MAKLSKYSRLRPKVSVLTYIILGLVFVGLTLTIFLSIDTPKQKFDKLYGLEKNNIYELSTLKKVNKKVNSGEDLLVIFINDGNDEAPAMFLHQLVEAYEAPTAKEEDDNQYKSVVSSEDKLPKKVYFVKIKEKEFVSFSEFLEKHDEDSKIIINRAEQPLVLAFNDEELVAAFNNKSHGDLYQEENPELAKMIRNLRTFLGEIKK